MSRADAMRGAVSIILLVFAMATATVAILEGVGIVSLPYDMALIDRALPRLFRLHMMACGIALALIPIVLIVRRNASWHRPVGWITAVAVVVGGLTALPVSIASSAPVLARAGLFVQGIVWLSLIGIGVWAIRRGQRRQHAQGMIAMAAVASGALWLRVGTTLASVWELPFRETYALMCWFAWVVPLFLVGYMFRRGYLRPF